jgi:hypothetical protein
MVVDQHDKAIRIMNLAPIGIFTYTRLEHLTKTINALKENDLAKESELYIFSDGPRVGDEEKVFILRDYLYTVNGFKKVNIVERKTNKNAHSSAVLCVKELFKKYGKCILLEDDIIVSPFFLKFINDGLNFYKDNKNIFAICGFNIPTKFPDDYKYDYYLSSYMNGWGVGYWEDRGYIELIDKNNQYNEILKDRKLYNKVKKIHPNLIKGLKQISEGTLNAGDFKSTFNLIKHDKYIVKPIVSYVNNIGHDGSGIHSGNTNKYNNEILNTNVVDFNSNVKYEVNNDMIWRHFHDKRKITLESILTKIKKVFFVNG